MKTAAGSTLISNGTLVDGTGAAPVPDGAVVVTDGRIAYAGPAAGAPKLPMNARRIDAGGGTIMPGLVEAHFHPTYFNVAGKGIAPELGWERHPGPGRSPAPNPGPQFTVGW
jgi:imidazolonepropionase-like amidohydrolase